MDLGPEVEVVGDGQAAAMEVIQTLGHRPEILLPPGIRQAHLLIKMAQFIALARVDVQGFVTDAQPLDAAVDLGLLVAVNQRLGPMSWNTRHKSSAVRAQAIRAIGHTHTVRDDLLNLRSPRSEGLVEDFLQAGPRLQIHTHLKQLLSSSLVPTWRVRTYLKPRARRYRPRDRARSKRASLRLGEK